MIVVPRLQHKPNDGLEKKKQQPQIFWVLIIRLDRLMNKREKERMCGIVNGRTNTLKKIKPLLGSKRETDLIIIFSSFHFGNFI